MNVLSLWGDHCFFNQLYWDIITFNKLHPFKVYNSKSFDSCSHTCETPNTRYRLFQPHLETSYAMCIPSFSLSLALVIFFVIIDLFAFSIILYNWNYTECILCVWLFFLLSVIILRFIHIVLCINSLCLFIAEYFSIVWLFYNFCIYSIIDKHWTIFSFGSM